MSDHRSVQALVVVDMQTAFVSGADAVPAAADLVPTVRRLLHAARAAGAVVVQLQNDGPAGSADEPGTPGWELFLPVEKDRARETVIRKTADDGFDGTTLGALLAGQRVDSLAICGVMSEMCVSATARSALALGFRVVLPHDAHATYDIPACDGIAGPVPHAMVSRVAEWALGDGIDVVARAADVRFAPGGPAQHP